ncbi:MULTISPECIES: ABC transporter ATP-binding protein [unclassified Clostridioides]|uniref:ATP-binding cassette domain-containing protein n=1 Tax=unclassified Clostridioides TaxID=2635829 RepID=UPI001D11BE44|nr:ABC transporter ATP-binding protein [Clostridioides sp. ES-S-0049-03]MCC0676390.1 ABC transporter ATP-binding protein [Clostridioides sp. ES-W-0018-02]MCC0706393.1 ABC transporter ATP-binding protein [Clostridioides sp. ES-S-0190-01]MCC0711409.1 ABC transporter ATP-binding protein [Clostridioides sp. ES-W-0017-02]
MIILELIDVNYKYEGSNKYVLKDVSAKFETGKMYVVIGKHQAGKSTLLSIISGLDDYTDGSIIYKGKDLRNINKDMYRNKDIGVIFKDYNLLNNETILENMFLPMRISENKKKNKREIACKILQKVGIDREKVLDRVENLSYYDKQKVCIAKSLSNNPDLIVCDDIIESTDDKSEESLINVFYNLAHKDNKCVIIATSSEEVALFADEIWGINNGKLMFIKSKEKNMD